MAIMAILPILSIYDKPEWRSTGLYGQVLFSDNLEYGLCALLNRINLHIQ